jgi:amiloride-sensitive sodium channel
MTLKSKLATFANESSIHGVKFILNHKSHKLWRVFWAISFIFSIFGLIYCSHSVYIKYNTRPDLSVKIQHVPMRTIPFPAVTICSPIFARNDVVNFADFLKKKIEESDDITDDENKYMAANMLACETQMISISSLGFSENLTDFNIAKLIRESAVMFDEMFGYCHVNYTARCHEILTDRGICWSVNLQPFHEVFNSNQTSSDFAYEADVNETVWSLDRGFFKNSTGKIPFKANKKNSFGALMMLEDSVADNVCMKHGKSFTYILHLPNEIPTIFHDQHSLPYGTQKMVTLTAVSYKTDDELRGYPPETRGCYFENEKRLKFFKSYTKNHCDLECLANHTLATCGCVKFSMPRSQDTPVCGIKNVACYESAMENWPDEDEQDIEAPCGCLRTCNDIEYSVRYEKESSSEHFDDLLVKLKSEEIQK